MAQMEFSKEAVLALLGGSAEQISNELAEFTASSCSSCRRQTRFIDEYPESWVAVYQGRVAASGASLEDATNAASAKGLPVQHLIMRHITRTEKNFFF
jgi:hypothetical protein